MKHTSATMFVDDYVQGRVPNVCAISGEPTTDRLTTSSEIDGPSLGWLFLLLFPFLGWLILAAVFAFTKRSYLRGVLPISEASYTAQRTKRRYWYLGLTVGVLLLLFGARFASLAQLGGATVVVGLCVFVISGVALIRATTSAPAVSLDGSRRWVTITRVHPAFAEAVAAQRLHAEPIS